MRRQHILFGIGFLLFAGFASNLTACSCSPPPTACPEVKTEQGGSPDAGQGKDDQTQDQGQPDSGNTDEGPADTAPKDDAPTETTPKDDAPQGCTKTGQACTLQNQQGLCAQGLYVCEQDQDVCKQQVQPVPEKCDGKDNNCDGKIDNDFHCEGKFQQSTGGETVRVRDIVVDAQKNSYIIADVGGKISLGGFNFTSKGKLDAIIYKVAPDGKYLWLAQIGGPGNDVIRGLTLDNKGGVYVSGYFEQSVKLNSKLTLTSKGFADAYALKLNAQNGEFQWAVSAGGPRANEHSNAISYSSKGKLILSGMMFQEITWAPLKTVKGVNRFDSYAVSLDPADGKAEWLTVIGGNDEVYPITSAVDGAGNVYITGRFRDTITTGGSTINTKGKLDIYMVKLDPQGKYLWRQTFGSADNEGGSNLAVSPYGELYLTATFHGNLTINIQGKDETFKAKKFQQEPEPDSLLFRIDPSTGNAIWVRNTGGEKDAIYFIQSMAFDPDGNVYIGGGFTKTIRYSNAQTLVNSIKAVADKDVFVAKYSSRGRVFWAFSGGGQGVEEIFGLTTDSDHKLYIAGHANKDAKFGKYNFKTTKENAFLWIMEPPK